MKTKGNRLFITELVLVVLLTLLNIVYNVTSKSYKFFAASDWKEIVTHPDDLDKIVLADLFSMEIQEEQAPESEPEPALENFPEPESYLPPEENALTETASEEAPAETSSETPKSMIEPPRFQGQDYAAFGEWLAERVEYPDEAAENNLYGVVHVSFIVEKDGSLSDIKIARSIDPLLDNEALRVVAMSPKWTPAKAAGKPVGVRLTFTVDFSLEEE